MEEKPEEEVTGPADAFAAAAVTKDVMATEDERELSCEELKRAKNQNKCGGEQLILCTLLITLRESVLFSFFFPAEFLITSTRECMLNN